MGRRRRSSGQGFMTCWKGSELRNQQCSKSSAMPLPRGRAGAQIALPQKPKRRLQGCVHGIVAEYRWQCQRSSPTAPRWNLSELPRLPMPSLQAPSARVHWQLRLGIPKTLSPLGAQSLLLAVCRMPEVFAKAPEHSGPRSSRKLLKELNSPTRSRTPIRQRHT